jgi:hypothetical protein
MEKFVLTIKFKNELLPFKSDYSIVPLFHYSKIEAKTQALKKYSVFELSFGNSGTFNCLGVFEQDAARIVPYHWIVEKYIIIKFSWLEAFM